MPHGVRLRVLAVAAGVVVLVGTLSLPAVAAGKKVHITKSDSAGNAVAGATFKLFRDDPPVGGGPPKGKEDTVEIGTCTTAANGQCDITGVPPGDYWVSETGPPAGYTPAPDSQLNVPKKGKPKEVLVVDDKTPANTSVNDPTGDSSAGDGTHIVQFGASTAVDETGVNVVVLFNDTTGLSTASDDSATGFAYSADGGETFVDGGKLPPGPGSAFFGEPYVAYDPSASAFVAVNIFCNLSTARCPPAVSRSTDGGRTWSTPVPLSTEIGPSPAFGHGASIAVDGQGAVHVTWVQSNADDTSQIMFSRSADGGVTFEPPVGLTNAIHPDFPSIDVNPNNNDDLFVSWGDYGRASEGLFRVFIQRSRNGGDSFGDPRRITGYRTLPGHEGTCGGSPRRVLPGQIFALDPPSIAFDPKSGALYATWTEHGKSGDEADIGWEWSEDNGKTWTKFEPIRPLGGPPGGLQFRPFVDVTPNGRVGIGYYDSRIGDPNLDFMLSFLRGSKGVHVADTRVTEQSFPIWQVDPSYDTALNPCAGIARNTFVGPGSGFLVAWGDGRDPGPAGNLGVDPNIFFARVEP